MRKKTRVRVSEIHNLAARRGSKGITEINFEKVF